MKSLDFHVTQLALRMKNLVVVDCSFPRSDFLEFKKNYETRFVWIPCRQGIALECAGGLSSFGKTVLVYGLKTPDLSHLDSSLNVKILLPHEEGSFEDFEAKLREFGPATLLIPEAL